jgi:hypothetical protein
VQVTLERFGFVRQNSFSHVGGKERKVVVDENVELRQRIIDPFDSLPAFPALRPK